MSETSGSTRVVATFLRHIKTNEESVSTIVFRARMATRELVGVNLNGRKRVYVRTGVKATIGLLVWVRVLIHDCTSL